MMNYLNFFPVRSATETSGRLSRPAFAQGFNTIFNTMMSFGGRLTSPLTATSAAFLRMHRQTRFCAILLTGVLGLVLAGCAGSSKDAAPGGNPLAVTDVQSIVGDTNILLGWTNPARDNITEFQITPHVVVNGSVDNESLAAPRSFTSGSGFSTNPSARVTYNITGLAEDTEYEVVIGVIYDGNTSNPQNLRLARMTTGKPGTGIGDDFDRDGFVDEKDNCHLVANEDQNNTDDADDGGDACDPDDDNDGVSDAEDAFRTDACASDDADNDGLPDSLVPGCDTELTADDNVDPIMHITPDPVTNLSAYSDGDNITVSWTNPVRNDIIGFNISWVNAANKTDDGTAELNHPRANVSAGASVMYTITNLTYAAIYNITVAVHYENGDSADSAPVQNMTGMAPSGDDGPPANPRAVFNIQTIVDQNRILVGWTNPEQENFIGLTITWNNAAITNGTGITTISLNSTNTNLRTPGDNLLTPGERVIYNIKGLTNGVDYEIKIMVIYENGDSVDSELVRRTTGTDSTDSDIDDDGVENEDDAFLLDACASADTDEDGMPDRLVAGCMTSLKADRSVFGIQTTPSENTITVRWTNPDQDDITGLSINWTAMQDPSDNGVMVLDADDTMHTIPDLEYDTAYEITITVLYGDGTSVVAAPVPGRTEIDPNADDDGDNLPNREDNCRAVPNVEQYDNDDDRVGDACDVDNDNNGLIEIRTLDDLALLRDDLNGDGEDDGKIDEITSVGSMGCPDDDDGGCIGYELNRSLDFNDADSYATDSDKMSVWTSGNGWEPIGSCTGDSTCPLSYAGILDGNNHSIVGLHIVRDERVNGIGLFAALIGTVRNLRLEDANVIINNKNSNDAGLLAGYAPNARFENILVSGVISGGSSVGALVGDTGDTRTAGTSATIIGVIVKDSNVSGTRVLGGLVGHGPGVKISGSYVAASNIEGTGDSLGGLVGHGPDTKISYSYVAASSIEGSSGTVGGLVGQGERTGIRYSYVTNSNVTGYSIIGGLIGGGSTATISHSYTTGGSVTGTNRSIGGLTGTGTGTNIEYSYAAVDSLSGDNGIGGLIGLIFHGQFGDISASYWDTDTTGQDTSAGSGGEGKTTGELQMPMRISADGRGFADSIYETWGNFWCHPDTGEVKEQDTRPVGFLSVWNLGSDTEYPVLSCTPGGPEAQGRTTP